MKELKGAILSQNHKRSHGGGPGARAPSIEMRILQYTRATVTNNKQYIRDQGSRRTLFIQFFPTNFNV